MTTDARIGFGTLFKIRTSTGPDVYTTLGEQASVKPPGGAVDSIDASHMQSPNQWREFIPGMKDGGEVEVELNYVPGGATDVSILSMLGVMQVCRVVFPSGNRVDFNAFITESDRETPLDDKMSLSVTLKVSGEIAFTAASAPTNSSVPAIGGVAQVGQTLTAYHGAWNNEPTTFTYQWKKAGANIGGATNRTYVPVGGDVGAAITVAVTAANSAGNATATSAATPNVIA